MTVAMRTLRLSWPREVTPSQLDAAMRLLSATGGTPLVVSAFGRFRRVEHRLQVLEGRAAALTTQLRQAIPGVGIEGVSSEEQRPMFNRAIELRLSTARRPLQTEQLETINRAILTALSHGGRGEALLLEWILKTPHASSVVPSKIDHLHDESLIRAVLTAPFRAAGPADADTRSALRDKRASGGWRAIGRVAVHAATRSRQDQLLRGVLQALRTAEAPGVHLSARTVRPTVVQTLGGRARVVINRSEFRRAVCLADRFHHRSPRHAPRQSSTAHTVSRPEVRSHRW